LDANEYQRPSYPSFLAFQANYTWVRKWWMNENIYCIYIYIHTHTLKEWGLSKEYGFLIFVPLNKIGD
jgi:hypothetical protein